MQVRGALDGNSCPGQVQEPIIFKAEITLLNYIKMSLLLPKQEKKLLLILKKVKRSEIINIV